MDDETLQGCSHVLVKVYSNITAAWTIIDSELLHYDTKAGLFSMM